jgi:hypothetical protein
MSQADAEALLREVLPKPAAVRALARKRPPAAKPAAHQAPRSREGRRRQGL